VEQWGECAVYCNYNDTGRYIYYNAVIIVTYYGGNMEIGMEYQIIYDDKGNHPVKKIGVIKSIIGNLISFESGEVINSMLIIRANPVEGFVKVEGGNNGTVRKG